MEITVNVEPIDLTAEIGGTRWDSHAEEEVPRTLGDEVVRKIVVDLRDSTEHSTLRKQVAELRVEEIHAQLAPIVTEAIQQGVRKTNGWGEPVGEPTTLRALIIDEVEKLLRKPADNYNRDKGTWIEALVKDNVNKVIRAELSEALAAEKAKVVEAVRAKASELIAAAVKEGIGR
ncbi:hypothetical protein ABT336_00395 [Micromonospora sp. NPDC000207]|uniref:hypothetical protein n=1 Tax=Micromonospora sp. NPDC000207 TaxID=3154246 RepID=UPI003322AC90